VQVVPQQKVEQSLLFTEELAQNQEAQRLRSTVPNLSCYSSRPSKIKGSRGLPSIEHIGHDEQLQNLDTR
jgi:hypothetical protein